MQQSLLQAMRYLMINAQLVKAKQKGKHFEMQFVVFQNFNLIDDANQQRF